MYRFLLDVVSVGVVVEGPAAPSGGALSPMHIIYMNLLLLPQIARDLVLDSSRASLVALGAKG